MSELNSELLINTSIDNIILNLDIVFKNLIQEIKYYLNLDLIYSDIKTTFYEESKKPDNLKEDIFKIGVKKTQKNKSLAIYISSQYKTFIRIILLREAYKCFVPLKLQENEIVNIFVIQKVEIDLQKSKNIDEWKDIKRKSLVSYDFMEAEFDRLDKFLKQTSSENRPSTFQFFFSYIRKNVDLIEETEVETFSLENRGFRESAVTSSRAQIANWAHGVSDSWDSVIDCLCFAIGPLESFMTVRPTFREVGDEALTSTVDCCVLCGCWFICPNGWNYHNNT